MAVELHPVVARLLAARGLSGAALDEYLDPSVARLLQPDALPGISDAVQVILPFLRNGRNIVVFGDYDVDGVCATAILVEALNRLGGHASAFIPDRFAEGYGMTPSSIDRMIGENPDVALVITVDNGINAVDEVRSLRERGVAVVVTDHHLPGAGVSEADALVNPKVAAAPGMENLCGAGVAFFLAGALAKAAADAGLYTGCKFAAPLLVMAGLATVADIVPLLGQNRILVAQSLAQFHRAAPIGLKELLDRAARRAGKLTTRDYGFMLGPRINAAGRMATAMDAYRLVTEQNREKVRELAIMVDGHNFSRKSIENRMVDEAMKQIPGTLPPAVVVSDAGFDGDAKWHPGVAGIVAARLMDKLRVPVAVVVDGRGSARAPDGYNVHDALAACSEFLDRFGGHAAAGGFSVKDGALEEFTAAFQSACAAQTAAASAVSGDAKGVCWELEVEPSDLTLDLCRALRMMEPFGDGNPNPVFVLKQVHFSEARPVGLEGNHLALSFTNRLIPRAVWWNHGDKTESLRAGSACAYDVAFTLEISTWGGDETPELRVVDVWKAS